MTIFHSYLDKTTVMEKTTILNYKMKGASVAEWLESLTSNHLSLISSGSISGQGIKIFHVMKPSSWIREGRWLYQVPGRAWIMSGGQFGFSSNIKAWKIAMGHILCRCDSKPNPQKTQTKKKWKKYFHKIKFEKKKHPRKRWGICHSLTALLSASCSNVSTFSNISAITHYIFSKHGISIYCDERHLWDKLYNLWITFYSCAPFQL